MANRRTPNKNIIIKYGGYKKTKKLRLNSLESLK
jgi:hypothetical protein